MKIVRVTYTAKADYVEQNKKNIQAVMADLRAQQHDGINYHTCLGADGVSFTHLAFMRSEEDQKTLNALPSFKHFLEQLKASGPEAPPKQELLSLVGSSKDFFE